MTNWRDPAREVATLLALIKLTHIMAGLYLWEFVLNLGYEYAIIMGTRKLTLSSVFYIGCRWCTLFLVILQFVIMSPSNGMNCQALISMTFTFFPLAILSASLLVFLRVYALWEGNKVVIVIASAFWLANATAFIYVLATSSGYWADGSCTIDHIMHIRISVISTFISDLVLLALMLSGILRWKGPRQINGTWWLLYKQGLAWIVLFALAEVPPLVLIVLNLNKYLDFMSLAPGVIAMTVGASRLYLGLVNSAAFHSPPEGAVCRKEWPIATPVGSPSPSNLSRLEEGERKA